MISYTPLDSCSAYLCLNSLCHGSLSALQMLEFGTCLYSTNDICIGEPLNILSGQLISHAVPRQQLGILKCHDVPLRKQTRCFSKKDSGHRVLPICHTDCKAQTYGLGLHLSPYAFRSCKTHKTSTCKGHSTLNFAEFLPICKCLISPPPTYISINHSLLVFLFLL